MTFLEAIILGIIEGITEFLPISSTGHMIIASHWLNIPENDFLKAFEVIIQFFAILSVVTLYWRRFVPIVEKWSLYTKIIWAFLPTAIIGFVLKKQVDIWLGSILIVAWSLIVGGVVLIISDFLFKKQILQGIKTTELNRRQSIILGLFQSLAMIPGVSRSAATIIGGLLIGMNKKEAAEFSFFLAIPTMGAATAYKLLKVAPLLQSDDFMLQLFIGGIVSYIVAIIAIKSFINLVANYGFKLFGIYRILIGSIILIFGV